MNKLEQAARQLLEAVKSLPPRKGLLHAAFALEKELHRQDHSADAGNKVSDHIAGGGKVILPVKAAQQIEEALESCEMGNWYATYNEMYVEEALSTIRAARAQEQAEQDLDTCPGCGGVADNGHDREFPPNPYCCTKCSEQAEQPVSQEYQDHLVNQSFDWAAMAAKHQFMEGYRIGLAEMREKCAKVCETDELCCKCGDECAASIRDINFEGDTGFRPVSEMIAEHKQDPKKAAAIEKAKMRKAEQKPVAVVEITYGREPECYVTGNIDDFPEGVFKLYTHPVRTKDLTDDEIRKLWDDAELDITWFARAVIAADREKNRGR